MLSIVIPTLDAAATLPTVLGSLKCPDDAVAHEVVISDGGSIDETVAIARAGGAKVLVGPRGRGQQLDRGARGSAGDWLLFLHADTRLAAGWASAVTAFIADSGNAGRAAYFRLRFDDTSPSARRVERMAAWRCRVFGLPYGDQGLLISRRFYESLGGFRPLPLMEDVDLVRRIGRWRLVALDCDAITSAVRYRRDGWWARPAKNLLCLGLWVVGVSPERIARIYR